MIAHSQVDSPIGPLAITVSPKGLTGLLFGTSTKRDAASGEIAGALRAYFGGDLHAIDGLEVDPSGTAFQRKVWAALRTIPAGQTWSYARLAREVGKPTATRAVGAANGANPVAIVIPCHRVIASDGTLGGYGGGLPLKKYLLELEGVHLSARVAAEFQEPLFRVNPAAS